MERKLNVSTGAGGKVAVLRVRFDTHLSDCRNCQARGVMCARAETLWRDVVLAAMRASRDSEVAVTAPISTQVAQAAAEARQMKRQADPDWSALYPKAGA